MCSKRSSRMSLGLPVPRVSTHGVPSASYSTLASSASISTPYLSSYSFLTSVSFCSSLSTRQSRGTPVPSVTVQGVPSASYSVSTSRPYFCANRPLTFPSMCSKRSSRMSLGLPVPRVSTHGVPSASYSTLASSASISTPYLSSYSFLTSVSFCSNLATRQSIGAPVPLMTLQTGPSDSASSSSLACDWSKVVPYFCSYRSLTSASRDCSDSLDERGRVLAPPGAPSSSR